MIEYKSKYEEIFADWLESAVKLGYVKDWEYEPRTFHVKDRVQYSFPEYLKTKTNYVRKTIIDSIDYTPDFCIEFTEKFWEDYKSIAMRLYLIPDINGKCWVDIKSKFQGKNTGSNREFASKRAMLLERHDVYVTRVTLDKKYNWFYHTYAPKKIAYKKNRKKLTVKEMFKNCDIK